MGDTTGAYTLSGVWEAGCDGGTVAESGESFSTDEGDEVSEGIVERPKRINILGVQYQVIYFDNPAEVDSERRKALWGQVDYWTRTIKVYDNGRPTTDIWKTIIHEIIHAIGAATHRDEFNSACDEDAIDCLALGLMDVFTRNRWLIIE